MNAVPLQIPGHEREEITVARNQDGLNEIPALRVSFGMWLPDMPAEGLITRWRPTDEERAALANGADIWLEVMTFGQPMQPVRLGTECPLEPTPQG